MICMRQSTFTLINPTFSKKGRIKILTIRTPNITIEDIFYLNGKHLMPEANMQKII